MAVVEVVVTDAEDVAGVAGLQTRMQRQWAEAAAGNSRTLQAFLGRLQRCPYTICSVLRSCCKYTGRVHRTRNDQQHSGVLLARLYD